MDLGTATIESPSEYPRVSATAAPVACIELDRFCEDCGYNLRTLPVWRDEGTGIPVVRCTECGRFQPANDGSTAQRPWLSRMTAVMLAAWMLTMVSLLFFGGMGEAALSYATLDELTVRGASTVQRIGNTTIRTWTGSYRPLEIDTDYQHYDYFIATVLICSFLLAFICGLFTVVVFPHWRRVAYLGFMLLMSLVVAVIVATIWKYEAPHLFEWGMRYVMAHGGAQLLGGLAGIMFGRPVARVCVRILLPPGVRPRLAYLWLADNKPFPHR